MPTPHRIPYQTGLSKRALDLRIRLWFTGNWISEGRNVAAVRVQNPDGRVRLLHAISLSEEKPTIRGGQQIERPDLHAEKLLVDTLRRHSVDPKSVIELYSERRFCDQCKALLGVFPNARLTYSFPLRDHETKAQAT